MWKKICVIIIALALMITTMTACGGNTNKGIDKNDVNNYLGKWSTEHYTLTINKAGVGKYETDDPNWGWYDFTYEVKDEVLVLTYTMEPLIATFELNDDGTILSMTQNGFLVFSEGNTDYVKQD